MVDTGIQFRTMGTIERHGAAHMTEKIMENQIYNAKSLLSIANFWGEDITPEQAVWLDTEVNCLPKNEQEKFLDLYLRNIS